LLQNSYHKAGGLKAEFP